MATQYHFPVELGVYVDDDVDIVFDGLCDYAVACVYSHDPKAGRTQTLVCEMTVGSQSDFTNGGSLTLTVASLSKSAHMSLCLALCSSQVECAVALRRPLRRQSEEEGLTSLLTHGLACLCVCGWGSTGSPAPAPTSAKAKPIATHQCQCGHVVVRMKK